MIELLGYNFLYDNNALDPLPTNVNNITTTRISNGIYNQIDISSDYTSPVDTTMPTDWDLSTIMDSDLNNNIQAGNISDMLSNITGVKIKRRIQGTFDWITIKIIPVTNADDLIFEIVDNIALNNTNYEYAIVPLTGSAPNYIEGEYIIEEILSQFDGVFICDTDTIYKFYAGVQYDATTTNQQIGVYPVLGKEKPIIISNGIINYQTGGLSGLILPPDYEENRTLDRTVMVKQREVLNSFLTNKKAKIIKDWNGNAWLCYITGSPSTSYVNNYGMGLMRTTVQWTEIGEPNNKSDLFNAGMIVTED